VIKNLFSPHAFSLLAAALLGVAGSAASAVPVASDRVQINWAPEQQLSEVKNNQFHRGWLRPKDWMQSLGDYLRQRADATLPAGEKLDVTIDDIKLAGDFEPWHGPDAEDIRFLKDIYPPRIDLHYRLLDANGTVLREGSSKLRDLSYLQRVVPNNSDPLRYDKRMLNEWLRKEFRSDVASSGGAAQRP